MIKAELARLSMPARTMPQAGATAIATTPDAEPKLAMYDIGVVTAITMGLMVAARAVNLMAGLM